MGDSQQQHAGVELLEHLRVQLSDQVSALQQHQQQLRATSQDTTAQLQNQQQVLDNLRYEADLLSEKLMKLRASRQDIEAELFRLKDQRIQMLDVISKLEDEEMQLVSEVSRIMQFKRSLLKEVPHFEHRARASASLAVVQDYLLATLAHLQQTDQALTQLTPAEWRGTANVQRPSANWTSAPNTAPRGAGPMPASTKGGLLAAAEGVERMQLDVQNAEAKQYIDSHHQPQLHSPTCPEILPTLHEGQPFTRTGSSEVITPVVSGEHALRSGSVAARSSSTSTSELTRQGTGSRTTRDMQNSASGWSSFASRTASGSFRSNNSFGRTVSGSFSSTVSVGPFGSPQGHPGAAPFGLARQTSSGFEGTSGQSAPAQMGRPRQPSEPAASQGGLERTGSATVSGAAGLQRWHSAGESSATVAAAMGPPAAARGPLQAGAIAPQPPPPRRMNSINMPGPIQRQQPQQQQQPPLPAQQHLFVQSGGQQQLVVTQQGPLSPVSNGQGLQLTDTAMLQLRQQMKQQQQQQQQQQLLLEQQQQQQLLKMQQQQPQAVWLDQLPTFQARSDQRVLVAGGGVSGGSPTSISSASGIISSVASGQLADLWMLPQSGGVTLQAVDEVAAQQAGQRSLGVLPMQQDPIFAEGSAVGQLAPGSVVVLTGHHADQVRQGLLQQTVAGATGVPLLSGQHMQQPHT